MPADTWPASLPSYLNITGYSEGEGDGLLRSQTDTGPGKVRRRSTAVVRPLSGSLRMSGAQVLAARAFHRDTLMGGALPFYFVDPITRGAILVRFAEPPSWGCLGGDVYDFTMALEVLP